MQPLVACTIMGNYAAKLLFHNNEAQKESSEAHVRCEQQDVEDNMCTPPLPEKRTLVDPRSASVGIYRTPIEVRNLFIHLFLSL